MMDIASRGVPVGSIIFSVFALLIISLIVLLILRHYLPLRTTPAFYLVPIFFALWLPSVTIILVPIDLASSAATDDEATRGIWLPERVILVAWRITYWLTFCLTWYVGIAGTVQFVITNSIATGSFYQFSTSTPTPATASHKISCDTHSAKMPNFTP